MKNFWQKVKSGFTKVVEYVRARNSKTFWVTSTSQAIVTAQTILATCGYGNLITNAMKNHIIAAVNTAFAILSVIGFFRDHKKQQI